MTTAYASGQIVLTNGSAAVTGIDTAWQISLINGGVIYPEAEGNPLPIASVDSDIAITTATKWQGASGTYDYALVRDTSYGAQQVANANTLAQLVKEFAAGTIFKFNASGTLAGRALFDTTPQSFSYLVSIDVEEPQLYVKASSTPGDWSGPFAYGTGPVGPPPTLHFPPVVTEPSGTPASIDVSGDGPYGLTFHIPRGADGDITWSGDWMLGHIYFANQAAAHGGNSYVCTVDHTAAAANEPGVGSSWDADWDLLASRGSKGDKGDQGVGDVTGPVASSDGSLALFNGATGKIIKDGGVILSSFAKTMLDDADAAALRATVGAAAAAGQVFTGRVQSTNPSFLAVAAAATSVSNGQFLVSLGTVKHNKGSNFASNAFTAPVAGIYHFSGNVAYLGGTTDIGFYGVQIRVNGVTIVEKYQPKSGLLVSVGLALDLNLAANDIITMYASLDSADGAPTYQASRTFLSGHLVS